MKIVELKIDDSSLSGFEATAFVENPAIEMDFVAFNKVSMAEMTYNDYPQAAVDAAKRGIELNEKNNMKCATQVGKVRAQQLVNGEKLSLDTIKRMRSFLIRQKGNFELATRRKDYNACGYISYLLWGGEAALPWAEKKLRQAGIEFSKFADEGKDVYLISCSAEKQDKPAPAAEMYVSPLFEKSLSFAKKQQSDNDYIKILSAKYHLTDLDQVIKPYDLTLKNFSTQQKKDWANKVYSQILDKYSLQFDRFMFLAGNAYTEHLMSKFKYKTDVLEGMRIGERMAYLDKFYIVTNNDSYATKHNFALVDPEAVILEELLKQEFSLYENVGFDFDGVLTTAAGRALAKEEIAKGNHVYIISARDNKDGMLDIANELGIPDQNVYAAKTNTQKLNYVQTLNIDRYYDDNPDVIGKIPGIGHKFSLLVSNIPQQPTNEPQTYAEVGPRGGINPSKKAPKSDTPNPNPKGEGSAKGDASTTRGADVPKDVEETLQNKADDFNERYKDKLGYGVNVGMLKSVYQRGLGAYNTSHSPNVSSAKQWALARVNAFLYLVKEGRPENKKYDSDFDLLPTKHPKREDFEINVAMLPNYINEASSGKKKEYFEAAELPSLLELKKNKFSEQLAEKQMVVGPLMTPNKLIPRIDENTGEEYQVFFSADTIEKIAYKMMQDKLLDKVNIEHDGTKSPKDVYLAETWIVKDPAHDKSTLYGFSPVVGEWYGIYKVDNRPVWNEFIKTGKVKGFSIEGYFYNNILTNK